MDRTRATGIEPGVVEWTTQTTRLEITFGQLDGVLIDKIRRVQKCMAHIGRANLTGNLQGVRYTKLTDNATFSAMSAILACDFGQILDSYEAMRCVAYLGREAVQIIAALGIRPKKLFGLKPTIANLGFSSPEGLKNVIYRYWSPIYTPSRSGRSSMFQDLEKGRVCEIDHINGKFGALGGKLGIDTPFMKTAVTVIKKLQNGELSLATAWDNLKNFNNPRAGSATTI